MQPHSLGCVSRLAGWAEKTSVTYLLLFTFSGCLFFYGTHQGDLWRTENLRAQVAREMLQSGNYLVPHFLGEPLFTKPPGMYWAILLCSLPWGEVTPWTARLPSALASTFAVFFFYGFMRHHLGRLGGMVAAIILPMSILWIDKASSAEIDTLQAFWVLAALLSFFRAVETEHDLSAPRWGWWLLAMACVTGGFLTKWTAPQFFYCTAFPYLFLKNRLNEFWRGPHLLGLGVGVALAGAWIGVSLLLEGPEVFWDTVAKEASIRFDPRHTGVAYPWFETLFHPARILMATLPWSPLALLAFMPSYRQICSPRERDLLLAFHCWVWPNMLFWSFPLEHTPRHSWPLFPGIAGLATLVWLAWHRGKLLQFPHRGHAIPVLLTMTLLWVGLKIGFVECVVPLRNGSRQPRLKGESLAKIVPPSETVYVFEKIDEGIWFYFSRPVRFRRSPAELTPTERYCVIRQEYLTAWPSQDKIETIHTFLNEFGIPMTLVRRDLAPRGSSLTHLKSVPTNNVHE